jgi:hypothetical protein
MLESNSRNTDEVEKAIRLYGEAVLKQNLKHEGKRPYFDALLKAAALDIRKYGGVLKALKSALDRIISSPEDYLYLIKKIEKSKRLEADEWLASYYLKIGDDENYLRVRQKNLEMESQYLDLAGYWRTKGDEKRYIETLEQWVSRLSSRKNRSYPISSPGSQPESILSILAKHYKSRGDDANLCRILMETARHGQLTMDLYKQIVTVSKRLNRWEESQPTLIKYARKNPELMARIFLYEKDLEAVIRLAKGMDHFENIKALIAKGIRESRPKEAIRIYKGVVEGYIEERSREHYRLAARYAEEIRSIYLNVLRDKFGWQNYIDQLRKTYAKLPALLDEFGGL